MGLSCDEESVEKSELKIPPLLFGAVKLMGAASYTRAVWTHYRCAHAAPSREEHTRTAVASTR